MTTPVRTAGATSTAGNTPRKLITRSLTITPADALDRLGLATGSASSYLESGEWILLDRDRVRLVPLAADDPRTSLAYALVETEHHNILVGNGPGLVAKQARAA